MDNKRKYIFIGILLIIIVICLFIFKKPSENIKKSFDISELKESCLKYYDGIRVMDFIDITTLFGTDFTENDDAVFLSNINLEDYVTLDTVIISVINTEQELYYYDIFRSFLDSNLLNEEDSELLDLFNNAILEKGDGYVYFILGKDAQVIEKDILPFYR